MSNDSANYIVDSKGNNYGKKKAFMNIVFSNKKFALVKRGRDYVLYKVTE